MHQKIFAGQTDVGLKRKNNEDIFIVSPEQDFCLAADGMGGAAAGEIASKIFADTTQDVFSEKAECSQKEVLYRIQKAFSAANEKILAHVIENTSHKGMGCTAEILAFSDRGFIVGHIGDSRTYRLRDGYLEQLTQDHTIVQQQFEDGLISSGQIKDHPLRNVIFRAVGIKDDLALDLIFGKIFPGDLFLLCSDGLTDMIPDEQILEILCSYKDIPPKADELIEAAKDAGGTDNITVVLSAIM
jgi:protein phosphatase